MITDLCTLFDAYPIFHCSADGRTKMVTFRSMDNKGDMREVMIGKDLQSITFEEKSEDIVTRLYVEGEYGDNGYVGIDDVNPTGLTYLLNFSYYKENGLFTAEHQAIYDTFLENIKNITEYIREHAAEITTMSNELNTLWGQPLLVQYNINPTTHSIDSTIKSSEDISDDKLPIAVGDILHIVGPSGTYRKEVVSNASTFGFQAGDVYAVKYTTDEGKSNAAGTIGSKEVSIEAKESAITQIERMKRQTTDPEKIAEYDRQIAEIRTQIQLIYTGVPETTTDPDAVPTVGLYTLYYQAMDQNFRLYNAKAVLATYQTQQSELESQFYLDMGDMQKDGYWSNTNYIQGQEQFLYADAIKVLDQMSRPARTYTVNRVAMSDVIGYDLNDFEVNTQVRIYDPKINVNDIVYVKKITKYLDTPWKDKVELTNESITLSGKSLDSILQRITSVASEMEARKDVFQRANALTKEGTILMDRLDGAIDVMKNRLLSSVSSWYTDDNGNIMFEAADGQSAMKLSGDGWMIANGKTEDGDWNWRTAATGQGITADAIVTGYLSAEQIEAGSITGDKLDIHAGDSLDLSANNSIHVAIQEEMDDLQFSSGDNLLPGTSSSIKQIETADEYVIGACEIDTDNAASDILTFRVHLAPQTDDFAPAIRVFVFSPTSGYYGKATYGTSRYNTRGVSVLHVGETIKAGEEGWATCTIDQEDDVESVEAVLVNVTKQHSSLVNYHSAKVEYGPATPYTPSLNEVKKEVSGQTVDMYEDSGKIETYRKSLAGSIQENKNAIAEITPEYIAQSVKDQVVYGTRNLILNSSIQRKNSNEQVTIFEQSEPTVENHVYTLSMDFIPATGVQKYNVCLSQGGQSVGYIIPYGTARQIRTLTFLSKYARQSSTQIASDKVAAWNIVNGANNKTPAELDTYLKSLVNGNVDLTNRPAVLGKRLISEVGYTDVTEDQYYSIFGKVKSITATKGSATSTLWLLMTAITPTGKELYTDAELNAYVQTFNSSDYYTVSGSTQTWDTAKILEADEDKIIVAFVTDQADGVAKATALETLLQIRRDMAEFSSATVDVTSYKTAYLDPSVTILDGNVDKKNIDLYLYALPAGESGRGTTTIYNAKLERGNAATGFTNAPEDNLYAGVNLLRNGGFEMFDSRLYPLAWGMLAEGDRTETDTTTGEEVVVALTSYKVCGPNIDTEYYGGFRDPSINTCVVTREGEYLTGQKVGIYSSRVELNANEVYTFSGYVSCKNATSVHIDIYETNSSDASPEEVISTISSNEYIPVWGNTQLSTWRRFEITFKATAGVSVSVYCTGPTTSSTEDVVIMVAQCKIEKGYFATEYSPCNSNASDITSRLISAEQRITPEAITSTVKEGLLYDDTISGINQRISETGTRITQTADSFSAEITRVEGITTGISQDLSDMDNERKTYIRFTEAGQELGKVNTNNAGMTALLSNDRLSFKDSGNEVAYISSNNLWITHAQILNSLEFTGIVATQDDDGSVNWSWKPNVT